MRRRSEPHTFEQRIAAQKLRLEQELAHLPAGALRDSVAARIEQLHTAAEMFEFLMPSEAAAPAR
jgi:hypothetical protein